jgi:hypothetical protein
MTLHLTLPPQPGDAELRELARRLERGDNNGRTLYGVKPVHVWFGSREAALCVEALRRAVGP